MDEKQLRKAIEQLLESQPDNQRLRDNLGRPSPRSAVSRSHLVLGPAALRPQQGDISSVHSQSLFGVDHDGQALATRSTGPTTPPILRPGCRRCAPAATAPLSAACSAGSTPPARAGASTSTRWNAALVEAYRAAPTPAARAIALDEFDDWFRARRADRDAALRDRSAFGGVHSQASAGLALGARQSGRCGRSSAAACPPPVTRSSSRSIAS